MSKKSSVESFVHGRTDGAFENVLPFPSSPGRAHDRRDAQKLKVQSRKAKSSTAAKAHSNGISGYVPQKSINLAAASKIDLDEERQDQFFDTDVGSDFDVTVNSVASTSQFGDEIAPQPAPLLNGQGSSHNVYNLGIRPVLEQHQSHLPTVNGFHGNRQLAGRFEQPDHHVTHQTRLGEYALKALQGIEQGSQDSKKRSYAQNGISVPETRDMFDGTEYGAEDESEDGLTSIGGKIEEEQTPSKSRITQYPAARRGYVSPSATKPDPDARPSRRTEPPEDDHVYLPDYTLEELKGKTYAELSKETWDSKRELPVKFALPKMLKDKPIGEKIEFYRKPEDSDAYDRQVDFYRSLGPSEWEEAGDYLVSKFSEIIMKLKEAKAAKRRILEDLEVELEERESKIRGKSAKLDGELAMMAAGGEGILRGKC